MIEIHQETCIGCGKCVKDCVAQIITLKNGRASAEGRCIHCGHCVAVCPQNAVSISGYDMEGVEECTPENVKLDPANLLRGIKFRRSIRDYRTDKVEAEKLEQILDAGRYTATAKNLQDNRFIFIQENLDLLKQMVWDKIDEELRKPPQTGSKSVQRLKGFYEAHKADPNTDFLFRNAPAVLFVASARALDAGLAAQNMELMAVSLGMGMLYNGYLQRAAEELPEIKEWLGAGKKTIQACMLLGYPKVTYARTAPRLKGDFIIK